MTGSAAAAATAAAAAAARDAVAVGQGGDASKSSYGVSPVGKPALLDRSRAPLAKKALPAACCRRHATHSCLPPSPPPNQLHMSSKRQVSYRTGTFPK